MPKPSPNLPGFEKSVTMTMAAPEDAGAETCVVWNISRYPVPRGFDGSLVLPFIKRYLEKYGYFGSLSSITAVGVLTDVPDSVLRGVYNSGIDLIHVAPGQHADEIVNFIYSFAEENRPPANLISISDPNLGLALFFQRGGYNILQPFSTCAAFQTDLLMSADDLEPHEESESAYWDCLVCGRDPPAKGYENFTLHLSSEEHQELTLERSLPRVVLPAVDSRARPFRRPVQPSGPPKIDHEAVTSVFWDINKCPVLPGHDARLVIKRFLETSGYSGPLTITAVGILTDIPNDILRGVYSSGIALSNVDSGAIDIPDLIHEFTVSEPPPANIMVISDPGSYLSRFKPSGYNCIFQPSLESLLVADLGVLEDDKCSEMRDCICWVCSESSGLAFQSFEDFTTHLASRRHQRMLLDFVPHNVRISRRE